jgi:hypothetical protein
MTVPKRSQAFPERSGTAAFPAFPSVPPLRGEGTLGTVRREHSGCPAPASFKGKT